MQTLTADCPVAPPRETPECPTCKSTLPIRPAKPGEVALTYLCVNCGSKFRAIYLEDAPRDIASNAIRMPEGPARSTENRKLPSCFKPARGASREALAPRSVPACRLATSASRAMDHEVTDGRPLVVDCQGAPFELQLQRPGAVPYSSEDEHALAASFEGSYSHVEAMMSAIESGKSVDPRAQQAVARDTLMQAMRDLDLFVRLGANPVNDSYPGRHSLHVAMLASAIGAQMGWDEQTLVDMGVGCLTHDLGMMLLPRSVYQGEVVLDDGDFGVITTHPLKTFDLIEDHMYAAPLISRMVAYQIHERINGSGYPRKRNSTLIHEAAKVAAIADAYIALVSSRPHRPAMMPYYAVEHTLHAARAGLYDIAAIRALLRTISLFPIGSCVQLSDGRVGRVLRCGANDYTRPIVESWRPSELDAEPTIVVLEQAPDVSITRPLAELAA